MKPHVTEEVAIKRPETLRDTVFISEKEGDTIKITQKLPKDSRALMLHLLHGIEEDLMQHPDHTHLVTIGSIEQMNTDNARLLTALLDQHPGRITVDYNTDGFVDPDASLLHSPDVHEAYTNGTQATRAELVRIMSRFSTDTMPEEAPIEHMTEQELRLEKMEHMMFEAIQLLQYGTDRSLHAAEKEGAAAQRAIIGYQRESGFIQLLELWPELGYITDLTARKHLEHELRALGNYTSHNPFRELAHQRRQMDTAGVDESDFEIVLEPDHSDFYVINNQRHLPAVMPPRPKHASERMHATLHGMITHRMRWMFNTDNPDSLLHQFVPSSDTLTNEELYAEFFPVAIDVCSETIAAELAGDIFARLKNNASNMPEYMNNRDTVIESYLRWLDEHKEQIIVYFDVFLQGYVPNLAKHLAQSMKANLPSAEKFFAYNSFTPYLDVDDDDETFELMFDDPVDNERTSGRNETQQERWYHKFAGWCRKKMRGVLVASDVTGAMDCSVMSASEGRRLHEELKQEEDGLALQATRITAKKEKEIVREDAPTKITVHPPKQDRSLVRPPHIGEEEWEKLGATKHEVAD